MPPYTEIDISPVASPEQSTLFTLVIDTLIFSGSVIVTCALAVQLLASVTNTL